MVRGRDSTGSENPYSGRVLIDLIAIVGVVLLAQMLTYWAPSWLSPLQVGFGLISVLFAPGYVTLVILIPHLSRVGKLTPWAWAENSLTQWEQILLSILISLGIVPVLGVGMSFTSRGIRPTTMVLIISAYTLVAAGVAAIRRLFFADTAPDFLRADIDSWSSRLSDPPTDTDLLLNLLIIALVLSGGIVVITLPSGQATPQFTEFYILNGNESENLDMNEYLRANGSDETASITMAVTNHERQSVEYTVVVQVQRAEVQERSVTVSDRSQLEATAIRLEQGESARILYEFTTPETETGCRVVFLLYQGNPPSTPTIDNAYRELHIWDAANPPLDQEGCPDPSAIDVGTDQSPMAVSDES